LLVMVCILAKGSGDYASPAYHDHPPQRLLQNFPDTTLARRLSGRRQPSRGDTSRMNREVQVRICEGLGVKLPGPTRHQTLALNAHGELTVGTNRQSATAKRTGLFTEETRECVDRAGFIGRWF